MFLQTDIEFTYTILTINNIITINDIIIILSLASMKSDDIIGND